MSHLASIFYFALCFIHSANVNILYHIQSFAYGVSNYSTVIDNITMYGMLCNICKVGWDGWGT